MRIESHLDLPKGAKWFRYRVSIDRPLWFNWRPLEGGGTITRLIYHVASIYGAFTYHLQHKDQSNVGKYTTHGSYGYDFL